MRTEQLNLAGKIDIDTVQKVSLSLDKEGKDIWKFSWLHEAGSKSLGSQWAVHIREKQTQEWVLQRLT